MSSAITPPPSSSSSPRILLLALDQQPFFDELYTRLIDHLASRATLQRASKPTGAVNYLRTNTPTAILITDPGVTQGKHAAVMAKVTEYVLSGGTAVFAGLFSSFCPPSDLDSMFPAQFGLPWQNGVYHRTTVRLNDHVPHIEKNGLATSYSQKAVFLKGVRPHETLYRPAEDSVLESLVFPSVPIEDKTQAAAAFAKVGEGWVGFLGDVNAEVESDAVVAAMCGV